MTSIDNRRCGVLARKLGMSRQFQADGSSFPVTVLLIEQVQVVGHRRSDKHGYDAVILGAGQRKHSNKPLRGSYPDPAKVGIKQKYCEFRTTEDHLLAVGTDITPEHFSVGQIVDASGVSIGRGFAGAMKRHNFRGLRATHGVSLSHRSHGSTGNRQDPGRVFKNKKMAGHMGDRSITVQNLKVVGHDVEKQILLVCGAVPGARGAWVVVRDAMKARISSEGRS